MSLKILHLISQRPDSTGSGFYLQEIMSAAHQAENQNFLLAAANSTQIPELTGISKKQCCFIDYTPDPQNHPRIVGMSDIMPYPSRKFRDLSDAEIKQYIETFRAPLVSMVERIRPDLIHSHHLWLLSSFARQLFPDLPMVTSCHGSDLRQWYQCPHLRPMVRQGCRKIDRILALSNEQKQQITASLDIGPEKIKVVGAGYNQKIFKRTLNSRTKAEHTILYAGKISRAKGVNWLLRALSRISVPFRLHLVGSGTGSEYEDCMNLAHSLGNRVIIHGPLSQPALAGLLNESSLFVLPSLHEGLPLSVIEALACGCRVIATDLPGTREIKKFIHDDSLQMINTPWVLDTDRTILADEMAFVSELTDSLNNMLRTPQPKIPVSLPSYFTWPEVFARIEKSWISITR